jgi:hypothetical protein
MMLIFGRCMRFSASKKSKAGIAREYPVQWG